MAGAEPNWDCGFCRFENRASAVVCFECGADGNADPITMRAAGWDPSTVVNGMPTMTLPETGGAEANDETVRPRRETPRAAVVGVGYRDAAFSAGPPPSPPPPSEDESEDESEASERSYFRRQRRIRGIVRVVAVLGCGVLLVWFLTWLFMPWHEHVRVTSARWDRTLALQHRIVQHGNGWGSPLGAFNVSCVEQQHGTHDCNPYDCDPHTVDCRCHDVATGEDCETECTSGSNGFSDCEETCTTTYSTECDSCTEYDTCYEQCPTYDRWCDYDFYEWPTVRTENTSGSDRDPIAWPDLPLPSTDGTYRLVSEESYAVSFGNNSGTWSLAPATATAFSRYHTGARWDIEVTHAGDVTPVREEVARDE
jgi:hypothetical protein